MLLHRDCFTFPSNTLNQRKIAFHSLVKSFVFLAFFVFFFSFWKYSSHCLIRQSKILSLSFFWRQQKLQPFKNNFKNVKKKKKNWIPVVKFIHLPFYVLSHLTRSKFQVSTTFRYRKLRDSQWLLITLGVAYQMKRACAFAACSEDKLSK